MEVETQQIIQTAYHHEKSIKCISKTEDNSVIATGGRDGKIFFYDSRLGLHKKIGDFSFNQNKFASGTASRGSGALNALSF